MLSKKEEYLYVPLDRLKKLSEQINHSTKGKNHRVYLQEFNKIFDYPLITQAVDLLKEQIKKSELNQHRYEDFILHDFNSIEQELIEEFNNPEISFCLKISKLEGPKEECHKFPSFSWRRAGLQVALRRLFDAAVPKRSGLMWFIREQMIKNSVDKILCPPNVIAWKEEQNSYEKKKEVLQSIQNIKRLNRIILDSDDLYYSQVDMERVCAHLTESLITTCALKTLKIKSINYSYIPSKRAEEAKLIFWINTQNPIPFTGFRARNFYKIISDFSNKGLEAEDLEFTGKISVKSLSHRSSLATKDFKDINKQISKEYWEYGFILGLNDLIIKNGYEHKINPDFVAFIIKH